LRRAALIRRIAALKFEFRHVRSLPAGSVKHNPDGFWKFQGV
jgi:hypothetical protein